MLDYILIIRAPHHYVNHSVTVSKVVKCKALILCDDPQQELNNIYKFLGIRKYKHDFNDIQQYEVNGVRYNDKVNKFLDNLHTVKKTIERSTYRIENILPESVITKYEHLTFDHFRNCH